MHENLSKKETKFLKHLNTLLEGDGIASVVASEALNYPNSIQYFKDLAQNGCVSGMADGLILYTDTRKFFDTHYLEIEELREEFEDEIGHSLEIIGNLKNFFAWFGFEQTAYQIATEWELY